MTTPITNQDTKVVTGKVRLSYVNVFKPRAAAPGQDEKYSLTVLIPKTDKATIAKVRAAIDAAKAASASVFGGKVPSSLKSPVHDGDGEKPNGGEYGPECKGHYVINASSSKQKPGVVDKDRNEIIDSTEVYSGCYGRVSVNFYAYNQSGNKGIACGLNNVQKLEDGDYLGGRSRAEDDFSDDFAGGNADDDGLLD